MDFLKSVWYTLVAYALILAGSVAALYHLLGRRAAAVAVATFAIAGLVLLFVGKKYGKAGLRAAANALFLIGAAIAVYFLLAYPVVAGIVAGLVITGLLLLGVRRLILKHYEERGAHGF